MAFWAERRSKSGKSIVNNPYTYALSLAVYCTAWTFYGSVGKAASSGGLSFLTIYLGPVISAPIWIILLKKIILISKNQGINSIADFISARHAKSIHLGILVTIVSTIGIIPYIALQLKAIHISSDILLKYNQPEYNITTTFLWQKTTVITILLIVFTILFGTRHLAPNERHEGMVAAIAFESIWKLIAFLSIGIFVTYGIYDGFGDVFLKMSSVSDMGTMFSLDTAETSGWSWGWMILISMSAVILLPRQFHVFIVENNDVQHLHKAAWLFPLYLLLINLFVIPIACAGLLHFTDGTVDPDDFVLGLPLAYGKNWLALFVFTGGLSAATGMVIVAATALSIMISNNLVLPIFFLSDSYKENREEDLSKKLLWVRRWSIVLIMILAFLYFRWIGLSYSLVSIGLISFTAIAQFLPVVLGALYWRHGTKEGAIAGISTGTLIWIMTLSLPTLAEVGLIADDFLADGYFGLKILKPYALLGMESGNRIADAAFWSLLFNAVAYIGVSLITKQVPLELAQADLFIDIEKYISKENEYPTFKRRAKYQELKALLYRFLGKSTAKKALKQYAKKNQVSLKSQPDATEELINYAETLLAGSIGAASAKIILTSVVEENPVTINELLKVLDQTRMVIRQSKSLKQKTEALTKTTEKLKLANEKLRELDQLKADFITTVTHELRTPITSIKGLSKIMQDDKQLTVAKRQQFLQIIVDESQRITRLINQVLDLEKIQHTKSITQTATINFVQLVTQMLENFDEIIKEKNIEVNCVLTPNPIYVNGHKDQLTQVLVNLMSNAIKFCSNQNGKIQIELQTLIDKLYFRITDNGIGIKPEEADFIFEKFTQVSTQLNGKPTGSGLGLSICKEIISQHQGNIFADTNYSEGARFIVEIPTTQNI